MNERGGGGNVINAKHNGKALNRLTFSGLVVGCEMPRLFARVSKKDSLSAVLHAHTPIQLQYTYSASRPFSLSQ